MHLQLEAVHALGEPREPLAHRRLARAQLAELRRHRGAGLLGQLQRDARLGHGPVDRVEQRRQARGDVGGDIALCSADHRAAGRLGGGGALAFALAHELIDARLSGTHAFLERLDVEPRAHLGVAGGLEICEQSVARRRVEDRTRRLLRGLQRLAGGPGRLLGIRHRRLRLPEPRLESLALGDGRLVADDRPVDLLGVRGEGRVVLAQPLQRLPGEATPLLPAALRVGKGLAQRIGDHADLGETLGRRVALRGQLQTRTSAARARAHGGHRRLLAAAGDDRRVSARGEKGGSHGGKSVEVVDDEYVGEDGSDPLRRRDEVARDDRAGHVQPRAGRVRPGLGDRDVDGAEVVVARGPGEGEGGVEIIDEHPLRERAEGRRDGALVSGAHLHRIADEPADAFAAAGDERGRGVADIERPPERRGLRRERLDLALGAVQPLPQRAHLGLGVGGVALRALVRGGMLGRGCLGHEIGIDGGERLFGFGAAGEGGVEGALLTLDAGVDGVEARGRGLGGAAQAREAHVVLRHERALRGDVGVEGIELRSGADDVTPRGGRGILRVAQPRRDLVDLGARLVDDRLTHRRDLEGERAVVLEQGEALSGERVQAPQALLHALQRERDPAGAVDGLGALLVLERVDPGLQLIGLILQHEPLGVALLLAAGVVGELGAQAHELVGVEARLRVADDGRDGGGLAGDLGLLAEGFELPAQLAGEVAQPGEVRLHRFELAKGLLLAPAVLEDSRGLFDEAPAVFGARLQHAVKAPLTDDDVHLTAETRVAEQLLHVEQTTALAVDRVLARAVAEERPTDRDLAVLDRQRAVGVVDRQLHLGPAERSARRGAGEDDILHLAAAEGLRPLLPHDPGERVDDVRLARAVGPDDARDAGFERERRRLRERLEALHRQALQVHSGVLHGRGSPPR